MEIDPRKDVCRSAL